MKNKKNRKKIKPIAKIAVLISFLALICICISSCKKEEKEEVLINTIAEPEETSNPLIIDPVSSDIVLDAFLKSIQAEAMEIADSYVWDASKKNGFGAKEFWQEFATLGYNKLLEYKIDNVGSNDSYSIYNVELSFAIPDKFPSNDVAESVAMGSIAFEPQKDEIVLITQQEADIAEMKMQSEIAEIYNSLPVDDGKSVGTGESTADGAENTGESEGSSNSSLNSMDKNLDEEVLTGKASIMITVVKQNDKYYVSPNNLLATYESEDMRSTQEIIDELNESTDEQSASNQSDVLKGIFVKLLSAKKYSNGFDIRVRVENFTDETLYIGSDINEGTANIDGIIVGEGENASSEMAKSYGFLLLGGEEGAIDSNFDTFMPVKDIEPGETEIIEDIHFEGLFELIFAIRFDGVYSESDEISKPLPVEIPAMKSTSSVELMGSPFEIAQDQSQQSEGDQALEEEMIIDEEIEESEN